MSVKYHVHLKKQHNIVTLVRVGQPRNLIQTSPHKANGVLPIDLEFSTRYKKIASKNSSEKNSKDALQKSLLSADFKNFRKGIYFFRKLQYLYWIILQGGGGITGAF